MNHFLHALIHSFRRSRSFCRWWMYLFLRIQCRERTYTKKQWNSTKNALYASHCEQREAQRKRRKKVEYGIGSDSGSKNIHSTYRQNTHVMALHCPCSWSCCGCCQSSVLLRLYREGYYAARPLACFHIFIYYYGCKWHLPQYNYTTNKCIYI